MYSSGVLVHNYIIDILQEGNRGQSPVGRYIQQTTSQSHTESKMLTSVVYVHLGVTL